jgi:dienelactone hydrolase
MSRYRTGEALVFSVATVLVLVHALDDAFVHRQPGVGLGQHALAAAITVGAGVVGTVAFPSLRPGLRAALAFSFGGLALFNGMLHVTHLARYAPAESDLTGALAAVAGVVLVALAVSIPWRHRGEGAAPGWRCWAVRVLVLPAAVIGLFISVVPVGFSIVDAHKFREPVGAPPSAAYGNVAFRASDGLRIKGWYRPSENGAAVVLVHGGGSDRTGSVSHAKMLARHGYGVLVYDARGRGESEGGPNGYGWDWGKDVDGALGFLKARDDVEPDRIGALGLSTGADVLIEVAARRSDLHAVVTDGAAAGSFEDWRRLEGVNPMTPFFWAQFTALRLFSGDAPGPPLEDLVARITSPLLLISADEHEEYDFNVLYDQAGGKRVDHWNLPDAHHTAAIRDSAEKYERRVVAFFDRSLDRN